MDRWKILRSADWAIILTIIPAFNSTYTWYRARLPARSVRGALSLPTTRHVSKRRRFNFARASFVQEEEIFGREPRVPLFQPSSRSIFKFFQRASPSLPRELETIRLHYKFSFSLLSGFIIIITNSFRLSSKWFFNFVIRDPSSPKRSQTSCFEYSVHESFFEM